MCDSNAVKNPRATRLRRRRHTHFVEPFFEKNGKLQVGPIKSILGYFSKTYNLIIMLVDKDTKERYSVITINSCQVPENTNGKIILYFDKTSFYVVNPSENLILYLDNNKNQKRGTVNKKKKFLTFNSRLPIITEKKNL